MLRRKSAGGWLSVCVLTLISAATTSPARAQGSTDPNPGALTLTGGFDFANAYFFRRIFQDDTGVVLENAAISGSRYYEGISGDETFGFLSVAGVVTVPFTSVRRPGSAAGTFMEVSSS